jgi:DNA-binding Lrp family transcriptional regulator
MAVPAEDFERVAAIVNAFPEVAHNYEREHVFNMWFVLATETPERVVEVLDEIERLTDIKALNLPKHEEYFIGMKVDA